MPAMTAHKASNAGWLMFTARAQRFQRERQLRACLRPPTRRFKLISGGADPDHDARQAVRERIADGRLFPVDGVSVARRGSGQLCVVCGRVINPSQEERVVEGGRGDARAVTHAPCYCLWREESRRPNM
jgi:hypothetical protein